MFRVVLCISVLAVAGLAQGQPNSVQSRPSQSATHPPLICVHGEGVWDPKTTTLTVISFSGKGCDVATASRTYTWTEDDDKDFGGMVTAQSNSLAFATGCLQEELANKNGCDKPTWDLIAMTVHAARAARENLCSRNPDWWVVTVSDSGAFGTLEPCGGQP